MEKENKYKGLLKTCRDTFSISKKRFPIGMTGYRTRLIETVEL